jgi:dihydroorotate dehydrogenase
MYKTLIRPLLFSFDPERIHNFLIILFKIPFVSKILGLIYSFQRSGLNREVFGLTFRNPVGLAAGFDKNAEIVDQLGNIGFGFIEIGTVTPLAQAGNEKPRIFRLKQDQALVNRMGFNNRGVDYVKKQLAHRKGRMVVGGNIGRNKLTSNEQAHIDYMKCFTELYEVVDYFVVNVSSPNTPDLRELQEKKPLMNLLKNLQALNDKMPRRKPILLKIAPDLEYEQIDDIVEIIKSTGLDGIIATNTTINRAGLTASSEKLAEIGTGGLSGKPLSKRSTEIIRYIFNKSQGQIPIIGVGGIHSPDDALEKLHAGASLIQLYTGFIYEGPGLIKQINRRILSDSSDPV